MITGSLLAASINLNSPGRYLHWSIFIVSEANLVLIAVMVVIFGAALLLPFPGHSTDGSRATGDPVSADDVGHASAGPTSVTTPMPPCGHHGSGAGPCRLLPPGSSSPTASPPTSPRGSTSSASPRLAALGVAIVSGFAHRHRGHRLVAHQPGRPFLQQPPPVERRGLHGLHGHPPVGQVLDGRLAGQADTHLGHRRRRLRGLGRRVLHRLPLPAELRLPVDLHQWQGRLRCRRRGRLLQPHELSARCCSGTSC